MKRTLAACVLLSAFSGCVATDSCGDGHGSCCPGPSGRSIVPTIPGVQGPRGEPIAMAAPYSAMPNEIYSPREMMAQSLPLDFVQFAGRTPPPPSSGVVQGGYTAAQGAPSGLMQANYTASSGMSSEVMPTAGSCPPGGCPPNMMMPAGMISPAGMPPGPGMSPGPGIPPPAATAAVGALTGGAPQRFPTHRSSVRFLNPPGMKVSWYAPTGDGKAGFSPAQIEVPGRYNFVQAAIYRLKLADIPNRPGLELYPTLEVVPSNVKTDPFLAHSAVPISFTDEDFDQVAAGNYVVKVIYLPDPQFQDLAAVGPDEVVSSRLEPGVDPIVEAHRRGSILLVIRLGNIDLEAPNTPAMDAPCAVAQRPIMPPQGLAGNGPGPGGMMPPNGAPGMMPYGMAPNGMTPNMLMGRSRPPMGYNGPMTNPNTGMMNPYGPMMVPNVPIMGSPPPMPPSGTLPPYMPGQPQPAPPGPAAEVTTLPDVQQVQYTPVAPADVATAPEAPTPQANAPLPDADEKKSKSTTHRWWSTKK